MKYILYLLCIFLWACTNDENTVQQKNQYEQLANELFKDYHSFTYKVSLEKERGFTSLAFVNKNEITNLEVKRKIIFLQENGWRLVKSTFDDQITLCKGNNDLITFTDPKKTQYRNSEGRKMSVKTQNLNKWIVSFQYNYHDIDVCK